MKPAAPAPTTAPPLAAPASLGPSRFERAFPLLLTGLLLLGYALRLRAWFFAPSLTGDEAMLAAGVSKASLARAFAPLPWDRVAAPGFVLLIRGATSLLGESERVLRAVPLVAGLVSLPLFAAVAHRLLSKPVALLALFAFAILAPIVRASNEASPAAVDLAAALAILDATLRSLDRRVSARRGAVYALAGVALLLVSNVAIVGLLAAGATLGLRAIHRRAPRAARRAGSLLVVWVGAFVALWLLAPSGTIAGTHLADPAGRLRAPWPTSASALGWYVGAYFDVFRDPTGFLQPALAAAAAIVGLHVLGRRSLTWVATLVLPVALALLASRLAGHPFGGRAVLFLVPSALLLAFAGLDELRRIPGRPLWFVVAASALLLQPLVAALSELRSPEDREEVRPVLSALVARVRPGDAVYVHEFAMPQVEWYLAHGLAWPAGVEVIRAAPSPDFVAPTGSTRLFTRPTTLEAELVEVPPRPPRTRVWALLAHEADTALYAMRRATAETFQRAGFLDDADEARGLDARGATVSLFVAATEPTTVR